MVLGSGVFPTRNKTYYIVAIAGYSRTHLIIILKPLAASRKLASGGRVGPKVTSCQAKKMLTSRAQAVVWEFIRKNLC